MKEQMEPELSEAPFTAGEEIYLLPTSFAQRRLWFLHQLDPSSPAYHVSGRFLLRGPLAVGSLVRSLAEVVRRHEILRTTFLLQDDEPVQAVATDARPSLPYLDLGALPPGERASEMQAVLESSARRPFDLERGPVLRCVLLRLTEREHAFLYVMHHIITDGWSESIFIRELATLYNDFAASLPPSLPELPIQYGDFAQWQKDSLQGDVLDRLLAYWRDRLDGVSGILELPTDHPRPAVFNYRGTTLGFAVPEGLSVDLRRLQERESVTLFSVMLAAFAALLSRYTGQPDLLIGSPVANRNLPELEELIGLFLNTLVLRLDLSGNPTSRELVTQAQDVVFGALEHQDLLYERLLHELRLDRDPSRNPLFQVALVLQNTPADAGAGAGGSLEIEPLPATGGSAKFDLQLTIHEIGERIHAAFEYATDLFEETTIRRFAESFLLLLGGITRQPQARMRDLPLLGEAARRELLALAGSAATPGPGFCLHEKFVEQAARTPGAVAVTCEGEALTYAALDERSDRLARYLQDLGIGPEVRVGIYMERSLDLVVAVLGVLKAGGSYLPIDVSYPQERITYMLEDAAAAVLLTRSQEAATLPRSSARIVDLEADGAMIARGTGRPVPAAHPGNAAYVIYTSGSTGRPKGVIIPHANVAHLFEASNPSFAFSVDDVWTLFHSHAFDFSVWEIWGALLFGGRLVVVPYLVSRSPELFAGLLEREGVTILNQTPSAFRNLLTALASDGAPRLDRLRRIVFGGEALEVQSLASWWQLHDESRPVLVNMYGITETTVHVTWRTVGPADAGAGSRIGRPLPHLELHLLDASLSLVPPGVPGEIFVGGEALARGYLDRPALTAERFAPDPFSGRPGARLYRSGDLAVRRSRGELEYLGRIDHQVKVRGFRIELGEIEAALLRHPAVRDAVVVLGQDAAGESRLVAYPVLAAGTAQPGHEELRAWLERELPAPMIPAAFLFLESLPLTPHGKIDQRALPSPEEVRPELEREYVPPRTPVEEIVEAAWSAALGVDRVGVYDNFFTLGGDSIRTLKVVGFLRDSGFEVSVQQIFLHPTVSDLAREIAGKTRLQGEIHAAPFSLISSDDRDRLPEGLEDAYPLSNLQLGMLFHMEEAPGSSVFYNINSHHLRLPFDPAKLQQAITHITMRHPVLRTSFDLTSYSEPLQLVHREPGLFVTWEDLRHLSAMEQQERIDAYCREQLALSFDLERAPQVRFHLHWRTGDQLQLTLTENHAILDGWSLHTLYSEILTCYSALLRGEPLPPLPLLTTAFRDFIWLERQALSSEEQGVYWQNKLDGCSVIRVPRRRQPIRLPPGRRGLRVAWRLPANLTAALQAVARSEGVSLKSVFLAVHCKVMGLLGGTSDVLTGMSSNGRPETADGQNVCGLFLNTLPLRIHLGRGHWKDLVRTVHATQVEVLPYRRYPLAALQARHGREALIETSFVYLNFHVMEDVIQSLGLEAAGAGEFIEETNFVISTAFMHGLGATHDLLFNATFDRSVLDEEQIREIEGYYKAALQSLAADPEAAHDAAPLLSPSEIQVLTADWSGAGTAPAEPGTLHGLFEAQVDRTPEAVCIESEGRSLTFREVDERANRLAGALSRLGLAPEARVALWLDRSADLVIALLGVLKAGGAYLPVDPGVPAERLGFLLRDAGASAVITRPEWRERLPTDAPPALPVSGGETVPERPSRKGDASSLAYVLYTSGSTGTPKGVGIEHRHLLAYLQAVRERLELPGEGTYAHVSTFAADLGNTVLFPPLCFGGTLRIASDAQLLDPNALADELGQRPADCLKIVPSQLSALLDHPEGERILPRRRLILGGEAASWKLIETVRRLAPDCRVFNHYGPTETTVGVVAGEVPGSVQEPPAGPALGKPLSHARVYVLHEGLQPVPAGTPGELFIGGAGVSRGYIRRPDLTAERFVPDPFTREPGARLYRTGDLVRWRPGGDLEFLGRRDHQVKIRGFRVELGEIEAALRRHPAVRDTVVLVRGEDGDRSLVAYVVADGELTEEVLRRGLAQELPAFMVPAAIVLLAEMPLTANGKIDRQALEASARAVPERHSRAATPKNELEVQLLHIWQEVLGIPRIDATDDFFALGGSSLHAVRLVGQIRKRFGRRILLADLIDHRSVRELAGFLRTEIPAPKHLVPVQPRGERPPLYFVHPGHGNVVCYLELARQLGPEQPFYGLQSLDLDADEDPYLTVEEMAARYVRILREARPHGPYLLGGWSFGGLVAFEMARQLTRQGESVPRVLLLDTRVPVISEAMSRIGPELLRAFLLIDEARGVTLAADQEQLPLTPQDIVHLDLDAQLDLLLNELWRREAFPPDVDREMLRSYFHVRMARIEAMHRYVPEPWEGRLVLFRAHGLNREIPLPEIREIYRDAVANHPSYGWSELAREIEIEPVTGHHESMVQNPDVVILAAALRKHVDLYLRETGASSR